jgi:hypothetical protein
MRHAATILLSARSLFTPVNWALPGHPSTISLSASGEVRAALLDLQQLVTTLAARPTHVMEILPTPDPDYIGYCDASAFGVGDVWFSGTSPVLETVWQQQRPLDITAAIVSEGNPTGANKFRPGDGGFVAIKCLRTACALDAPEVHAYS